MKRRLYYYKMGSSYKVVSVPADRIRNFPLSESDFVTNEEKLYNNLIRAKTTIRDLIICNDFYYFVTLTINSRYNRYDLDYFRRSINNKIRKSRLFCKKDLFFVLVPEQHKDGAWHMHGVFSKGFCDYMYCNKNGYLSCSLFDYLGFTSISIIQDKNRVSSYILKYICKDFEKREKGKHLYFASKGLSRPQLLMCYEYQDTKFDLDLYKNEYSYFKIFDSKPNKLPLQLLQ